MSTQLDSLHIQERDVELLRGLFESRVMTTDHVAALFFDGKRESAKKRLQRFKAAGFIQERERLVNEPSILFLTRKAFILLRKAGALAIYPALSVKSFERRANVSDFTIQHELAVMDVKTAFHTATRENSENSIAEFSTWPLLYKFKTWKQKRGSRETFVRPDGFIRLRSQNKGEDSYFLEVDRSTEAQSRLIAQSLCYRHYYYGGGFAVRNGASRGKFKEHPFRVLMVFKSADRRNNTAERLLQLNPPILTQICLSTLREVTADPLGPVWIQPKDYRDALLGTRFDLESNIPKKKPHPQPARDSFVDSHVPKFRLSA